jgi:xanthine dehydrogenase accessory factor
MIDLINEASLCLLHEEPCVLCEITETSGSTPQRKGSRMVVSRSRCLGTVGGGALELECTRIARHLLETGQSQIRAFSLGDDLGMACGGDSTVLFRFIDSEEALKKAFGQEKAHAKAFIFGCGHVGLELAPLLDHLGWDVVVYDNRPDYANPQRFACAKSIIVADYQDILGKVSISDSDYVIIMTHGHLNDRDILLQALSTGAAYIGCIGSRHKIAATNEYLIAHGVKKDELERIHTPIGLELYGNEPEEIAISIAAEMIRHRSILNGLDKR